MAFLTPVQASGKPPFDRITRGVPQDVLDQSFGHRDPENLSELVLRDDLRQTVLEYVQENAGSLDAALALNLKLSQGDISEIQQAFPGQKVKQVERVLMKWIEKNESKATVQVLLEALYNSDDTAVIQHICHELSAEAPKRKLPSADEPTTCITSEHIPFMHNKEHEGRDIPETTQYEMHPELGDQMVPLRPLPPNESRSMMVAPSPPAAYGSGTAVQGSKIYEGKGVSSGQQDMEGMVKNLKEELKEELTTVLKSVMQPQMDDLKSEIEVMKPEMDDLKRKVEHLTKQLDAKDAEIEELEAQLKQEKADKEKLKEELKKSEDERQIIEKELAFFKRREEAQKLMKQAEEAASNGKKDEANKLYKHAQEKYANAITYADPTGSQKMEVMLEQQKCFTARQELKINRGQGHGPDRSANPKKKNGTTGREGSDMTDGDGTMAKPDGGAGAESPKKSGTKKGSWIDDLLVENPNISWNDIGGLDDVKENLKLFGALAVKQPHLLQGKETASVMGILLYGPPGTGKTLLAKAMATELSCSFYSVSSSDLMRKWVGETEQHIRDLFKQVRKEAEAGKLIIIFIDEVDSLCSARSDNEHDYARRFKGELLKEMDGIHVNNKGIVVLGATNTPWVLDDAFKRRFQKQICIPPPEKPARKKIFEIYIMEYFSNPQVDVGTLTELTDALAEKTNKYSGADIKTMVKDVVQSSTKATHFKKITGPSPTNPSIKVHDLWTPCDPREHDAVKMPPHEVPGGKLVIRNVRLSDFEKFIEKNRPTVTDENIKKHEDFQSSRQS